MSIPTPKTSRNNTHDYWEDPITQSNNPQNYSRKPPLSSARQTPSHHQSLSLLPHPYAPSYTPSRTQDLTLPTRGRSNIQVYHQLRYPTASNKGSMKKKKRFGAEGAATESSSHGISDSLPHLGREDGDQDVRVW